MGMVFQNYAVWPHKTVFENVVFGLKLRKVAGGRGAARRSRTTLALVNLTGLEEPLSERAVRRPAAARRARPLAGGRAANPAARRAAVQPRRQAARAHARRAQGAAAPHRHHLRLRHPRPGRGAGAVRPDRGDAGGRAAAIRHAVRGLRPAGQPHGGRLHGAGEPGARQGARAAATAAARSRSRRELAVDVDDARRVRARRQRRDRDPAGEHPPRRAGRRRRRAGDDHQPRLPRQYQRILCGAAVRPDAAGADPSAAAASRSAKPVAVEIDATQCSVFRAGRQRAAARCSVTR